MIRLTACDLAGQSKADAGEGPVADDTASDQLEAGGSAAQGEGQQKQDSNADSTDDDAGGEGSEESNTDDACPAADRVWEGNFDYEDHDITQLQGISIVTGAVTLHGIDDDALENLACVRVIESSLFIRESPGLTALRGLRRLESIGTLNLESNPDIVTLEGFELLESCDEDFEIHDCPQLSNLDAIDPQLSGSLSVVGNLFVSQNSSLPQCAVDHLASSLEFVEHGSSSNLSCVCDGAVCASVE